ncbi:MAG: carboxypeptidase-like regulatory domain-containing protein [Pyrinomonadaceae bacterium]|nr:carboxypeptidase-like regulatory domain-containing protein [Pyrinomonadaceae bacterium]
MKVLQILFLMLGLTVLVNAQKAILSGILYDAVGAVIPEVKVTAVNEKGEKFEAVTNDNGVYSLSLPYNLYDARTSSANSKIAKFEIIVDLEYRGFEKFVVKDFKFIPAYSGKMFFDIALDVKNPEPCGYAGAGCLESPIVENTKEKVQNKILQRPLEKLPKEQNKTKRKNN